MSFRDVSNGDKCSDIKATLAPAQSTNMLCTLLKVQPVPHVDMERFDRNVLEYHSFVHCSEKPLRVRSKIQVAD